jgi:hypothetical protein
MIPLGIALMAILCDRSQPTFLLRIALVGALCTDSTLATRLCLGSQAFSDIL